MKRVLLTGGTGFVGANLVRRLLREGHSVQLLVRPGYQPWRIDSVRDAIQLVEVELAEADRVKELIKDLRPDWVFHLAAHGAYSFQTDLNRMVQTNFVETVHLLEACRRVGIEAFVHTGSSSEYGFKNHPPLETESVEPMSGYAVTKASATLFCRYLGITESFPVITLRLYSVFGPFEEATRLMPTLVAHGMRGVWPSLANPTTARDYVYTEDVEDAYLLAASQAAAHRGSVYNVGTGVQTSLKEVAELVRRYFRIETAPNWGAYPDRSWDTDTWVSETRKIREELGWRPGHRFEEGFEKMANWFKDLSPVPEHYRNLFPGPTTP